jgi:hypothetical protein
MSHTMKVSERIIEHRLRGVTNVTEIQFGFMPEKSTMETIFLIRQLMERYMEQKKDLYMVFIDLEKAYDKMPRNIMWWALQKHKVMERYREQKKDLHMVFIDLEKAYDKVSRNIMWWALQKHKVSTKYITLIKNMYNNVVTSVRTSDEDTNDFPINIGPHQWSMLSPYLFALMMNEVTRDIQGGIPWCMQDRC